MTIRYHKGDDIVLIATDNILIIRIKTVFGQKTYTIDNPANPAFLLSDANWEMEVSDDLSLDELFALVDKGVTNSAG